MNKTKQMILSITTEMLHNGMAAEALTVRAIADAAGVGVAAVNYHFGSKDNLLHTAALALLEEAVLESNRILMDESLSPQDQLKSFILDLTKVFYTHRNLTKVYLGAKFTEGSLQSATFIQPVLRRIFPDLPEDVIRVRAVQIAVPLQYVFIHEAAFEAYMGRPFDEAGVMAVVAQFVSNML